MYTVIYQTVAGTIRAVYVLSQSPDEAALVAQSGVPDDIWDGLIAVIQGHLVELYLDVCGDGRLTKWK